MYGLKHRLRGVDMATLRVCVRGFAVSRHFMSVVRVIGRNCRKPLFNITRRQTHLRMAIRWTSDLAARRPSEHLRRSRPVDGGSSSTLGGVVGREGSTPEHSAWSRELYLSAATSFTVGRQRKEKSIAPRQGQVDRKGFGAIQIRLLPAKDLI